MSDINRQVAVIMSVYKGDSLPYVRTAVESVLNQSFRFFVFYIQQDGPINKDIDEYLSSLKDERVIYRKRDINVGLASSLNELLSIVLPEHYAFIARMDADDYCSIDRFEKQIAYFDSNPDVDCLGTWAIEITDDGSEFFKKEMPVVHSDCLKLFRKRDCMIHPTVMFRSSFFERAGYYATDTYFGEDTMMWAQGFKSGCIFANIPEFLYYFRVSDSFFERRRGWKHAKGILSLRKRVNRMLGFGIDAYLYSYAYAIAKLMPVFVLNLIYKIAR